MTIVDNQHASELVTDKGKVYKYDAIECMMNHLDKWDQAEIKFYLVADFDSPKKLVDATQAHYMISQSFPSPMGEFLTGFENRNSRDQLAQNHGGTPLSWEELQREFSTN